jgi:HAD superfamily hydrolase (TIGR01509 family)
LDNTADLAPPPRALLEGQNVTFVLFDLGGVLVDVDVERAERAWVSAGHNLERFRAAFYESGAKPLGDLGQVDVEGMRSRVQRAVDAEVSSHALHAIWGAVVSWRPWVNDLLARVSVPYGVLSTIDPVHAARLGPLPGASPVVYSCNIGAVKPDPAAFAEAARQCPVPPPQVRYVDDLAENVLAARVAGFNAYQVTDRASLLRALSDVLGDEL